MAVPLAFFAVFFAYPVAAIVGRGLQAGGRLAARADRRGAGPTRTSGTSLWFTIWQALASTALTLLVALPGAYVFARFDFPGKQLLRAVVTVPFVLPTVVVGPRSWRCSGAAGCWTSCGAYGSTPPSGRSCSPTSSSTTRWSCAPSAGCGRSSTRVRRRPRGCSGAGRFAAWRRVTLPALGARRGRRRADGLPLHLHLLRRRPDPRRAALRAPSRWRSTGRPRSCSICRRRPC